MTHRWPGDRIQALRQLWAEGHSCAVIAARLGVTRNAVIGKVSRIGLPRRRAQVSSPKPRLSRRRTAALPAASKLSRMDRVMALISDGPSMPSLSETDVPRIATVDLERHHCRFPCVDDVRAAGINAPIFCGLKPVPGLPYCETHARRAYAPPPPLRRESNVVRLPTREMEVA